MSVLHNCEPKKVFEFFELLSSVPHGSGNTKQISDLCVKFALERGLEVHQDETNNVIIVKSASSGYEAADPIILQGHLDMVCASIENCPVDLTKQGPQLAVDGDWVHAVGTSLGGDNGIAVAMIMAILDDNTLSHPRLEAVFTVDEETGMDGAQALDMSLLKGRKLINLDSEDEGVITAGCAGGVRVNCTLPAKRETIPEGFQLAKLEISGLSGGHSGVDIDKGRASSNKLMARFLNACANKFDIRIVSLDGGTLDNVIASNTVCTLAASKADMDGIKALSEKYDAIYKNEYSTGDPGVCLTFTQTYGDALCVIKQDSLNIIYVLMNTPFGVQHMSMDIPGLVQTSLNLGPLHLKEQLEFSFSLRSSILSQKEYMVEQLESIIKNAGGSISTHNSYPGWEFNKNSELRQLIINTYKEMTGEDMIVTAIHGGLECGLFIDKTPGLDCVSLGPNMRDVHSVRERLSISSTARLYELMIKVLSDAK
ncbi:MAG: aminoacyl-histidine dipeptidase [Clostridia bacterium]|nr:aminoacyl-histidine dipeptidase [Clostridia bacterium]